MAADRWQDILAELRHCNYQQEEYRVRGILDTALAAADSGGAPDASTPASVLQQLAQARQLYESDKAASWGVVERVLADVEDAQALLMLMASPPAAATNSRAAGAAGRSADAAAAGQLNDYAGRRAAGVGLLLGQLAALLQENQLGPADLVAAVRMLFSQIVSPVSVRCSRCGEMRLLRQQVNGSTFSCGQPAALFRNHSCGTAGDAETEWYVAPDAKLTHRMIDITWFASHGVQDVLPAAAAAAAAGQRRWAGSSRQRTVNGKRNAAAAAADDDDDFPIALHLVPRRPRTSRQHSAAPAAGAQLPIPQAAREDTAARSRLDRAAAAQPANTQLAQLLQDLQQQQQQQQQFKRPLGLSSPAAADTSGLGFGAAPRAASILQQAQNPGSLSPGGGLPLPWQHMQHRPGPPGQHPEEFTPFTV
ncbi:hypothetical protein OEZ85_005441 [Tetradesmus obliquus]|uniref:PADR1 domain-containing protein n=1 Tax=Tetradesmus obliquus TaxID=3088 RepID=A0ABY8UHX9_TETOB|nr:hypothetical protein OEZ85_005441 [Tetradesmus obliquus]